MGQGRGAEQALNFHDGWVGNVGAGFRTTSDGSRFYLQDACRTSKTRSDPLLASIGAVLDWPLNRGKIPIYPLQCAFRTTTAPDRYLCCIAFVIRTRLRAPLTRRFHLWVRSCAQRLAAFWRWMKSATPWMAAAPDSPLPYLQCQV